MSAFDFGSAEAWEVGTSQLLSVGPHVAKIVDPKDGTSSGNNPQIELKVENDEGSLQDWVVITPQSIGKVVGLFDAASVSRPQEGEFDPETGRVAQRAIDRLANKTVGFMVIEEPDRKDASRMRRRIKGYFPPSQLGGGGNGDPAVSAASASRPAEENDRIPF